jgi:hypothetical protein
MLSYVRSSILDCLDLTSNICAKAKMLIEANSFKIFITEYAFARGHYVQNHRRLSLSYLEPLVLVFAP